MENGSVTIVGSTVLAPVPCGHFTAVIPVERLHVIAEAEVRCQECGGRWDLRFDPWTPGRDAIWCA